MLRFHPVTVLDVQPEAEDGVRLTLEIGPELQSVFRAAAGQHVVLRAQLEGREIRRTYSLTGAAGTLPLTLGLRVHPGGRFSRHAAQALRAGDRLELMPPSGRLGRALARGAQVPGGSTYVAFAAGSGITPILSIVRTALAEQPRSHVILFYGNRTAARTMFLEDLQGLKNQHLARLALHFVMSAEPHDIELFNGRLDGAKVRELAARLFDPCAVQSFFVCGPGSMVEEVGGALCALGVERDRIHGEHFAAGEPVASSALQAEAHVEPATVSPEAALTEVTLRMDGRRRSFTLRTGSETILEGASRAGIELPFSCRAGVCSTCRTRLLQGRVEMRANYSLEDWELAQGFILACQSRAMTPRLELDYDVK